MHPDRIVLGGIDARTQRRARERSTPASTPPCRGSARNNATAEMIKYASNSLLATLISFSNEIGRLCAAVGDVDVADVMRGVHASTLPHDARATARAAQGAASQLPRGRLRLRRQLPAQGRQGARRRRAASSGSTMPLLRTRARDQRGPARRAAAPGRESTSRSCAACASTVLGLAFKPDTDDVRESPAFPIAAGCSARRAQR